MPPFTFKLAFFIGSYRALSEHGQRMRPILGLIIIIDFQQQTTNNAFYNSFVEPERNLISLCAIIIFLSVIHAFGGEALSFLCHPWISALAPPLSALGFQMPVRVLRTKRCFKALCVLSPPFCSDILFPAISFAKLTRAALRSSGFCANSARAKAMKQ